jgi:dihydropteroate synthase
VHGSAAAAVLAVLAGASIVRTHDVGATVDALRVVTAVLD